MTAMLPAELAGAIVTAAGLVDDMDAQLRRERGAYREGYRAGWAVAYEVAYARAHREIADDWAAVARRVVATCTPARPEWAAAGRVRDAERHAAATADAHWRDYVRRAPSVARAGGDAASVTRAVLALVRAGGRQWPKESG